MSTIEKQIKYLMSFNDRIVVDIFDRRSKAFVNYHFQLNKDAYNSVFKKIDEITSLVKNRDWVIEKAAKNIGNFRIRINIQGDNHDKII